MKRYLHSLQGLGVLALGCVAFGAAAAPVELIERGGVDAKAAAADPAWRALAGNPATADIELVAINARAVDKRLDSLRLDLGGGLSLTAYRTDSYDTGTGAMVWSGVIAETSTRVMPGVRNYLGEIEAPDDPMSSIILVRNGDKVTANIHAGGELLKIRPLHKGGHALVVADKRRAPQDHPPEYAALPVIPMAVDKAAESKANTVIRVMVNYTPSAASQSGDITGLINLAVAESNQGYANSGVGITMQLANASQVSYTETGNFTTDLNRYRGTSDGYMDSIHATRNSVAADVGVLMVTNTAYCGLASGIGSTATTAFAEVYWDCATGYYSFAHEVGHLQSARHDPANDPTNNPYRYGHGYQYPAGGWRTIMAYQCSSTNCTRLNYWSNPSVTYGGVPMGTSTRSDNERVLNLTKGTVAAFR